MVDKPEKPKHVPQKQAAKKTGKEKDNYRGIVRLVGKDLLGHLTVKQGLMRIPGVGQVLAANMARIVDTKVGIQFDEIVGNLDDSQLKKIEEVVRNPLSFGIPAHMLNRPIDPLEGTPKHLVMVDLGFAVKQDIQRHREIRSYRGWRHQMGQKVRGQRTRSTGRTGMTVGVLKKAMKAQAAAASAGAPAKEEKKK
ncbi:30S ribosomal protein S13 [Candidatus Micrarchaeota archaeon]|nr:30S ribosomal protein S13 [Candidatus Micrarchaeota archaeon]